MAINFKAAEVDKTRPDVYEDLVKQLMSDIIDVINGNLNYKFLEIVDVLTVITDAAEAGTEIPSVQSAAYAAKRIKLTKAILSFK